MAWNGAFSAHWAGALLQSCMQITACLTIRSFCSIRQMNLCWAAVPEVTQRNWPSGAFSAHLISYPFYNNLCKEPSWFIIQIFHNWLLASQKLYSMNLANCCIFSPLELTSLLPILYSISTISRHFEISMIFCVYLYSDNTQNVPHP